MVKANAPYSGARRQANMQVADGRSTPADAARTLRSSGDFGNTAVDNVRRAAGRTQLYESDNNQPATAPSQPQEAYHSMSSEDAKLLKKMEDRRAGRIK